MRLPLAVKSFLCAVAVLMVPTLAYADRATPPEMETLQNIHKSQAVRTQLPTDDVLDVDAALDIRRDAQREAALSYGARGGFAKRSQQIAERLLGHESNLDRVFNFRALLIPAPSGLLIEPPIVRESLHALVIEDGGNEAAVADRILNINKQARIVTAPRDWRHYLLVDWSAEVPPPPRILWPQSPREQAMWNAWVAEGWTEGFQQAEESFDTNVNRLVADYNGMVRYRMLVAQGMISVPYALHEDRGVTGGSNTMRVGDRALRITGPSQFLTGSDLWYPADR